jgi:2-oxoglutarate dehydrogenase E1 component
MAMSIDYVDSLERQYLRDPDSLDPGWRQVLDVLRDIDAFNARARPEAEALAAWFRARGHLHAALDPLRPPDADAAAPETLYQAFLGEQQMASVASDCPLDRAGALAWLRACYATDLGVETGHLESPGLAGWVREALERRSTPVGADALKRAFHLILAAEEFEAFFSVKFPAKKRFGIEGGELILPVLDRILRRAAAAGVTDVVMGTMHRGRLNIVGNVLGKDLKQLIAEFKGRHPFPDEPRSPADVPYHLGLIQEMDTDAGPLRLTLAANPSHLEAVDPVVLGLARARQARLGSRPRVLPIIIHSDASFAAQGVVAECLQLADVDGFTLGGTLHLVINNQIGFTTEPVDARSSRYCTGIFRAIDSLILHVNGDRLDSGLRAADLALDFRQTHGRDAVIDLVCYRRNGHNEIDEPRFTQPRLYQVIDQHPQLGAITAETLVRRAILGEAEIEAIRETCRQRLREAFEAADHHRPNSPGIAEPAAAQQRPRSTSTDTGLSRPTIERLLTSLCAAPQGFRLEPKIEKLLRQRATALSSGIAWPLAEALALGSVLIEGKPVRFTGQDIIRGAFSHRHFSIQDMESGATHLSLNRLGPEQAPFEICNSPLSEYAVLGFEYGYSLEASDGLTLWEAQFGDFANGAQIILDQFIFSGRAKWGQKSGLIVLLPHGLEGQGPEHSSARPERLLQLAAGDNVEIVHPSTPANYFHLLRRQAYRPDPRPLIVLAPKSLLRLPAATSPAAAFESGTAFNPVIAPAVPKPQLIFCSGKIAYEVEQAARHAAIDSVAVVRLERLYPFPAEEITALLRRSKPRQVTWLQEEPANMGAWTYLDRRLEAAVKHAGLGALPVVCVSRPESASPAGSFHGRHDADQKRLVAQALGIASDQKESA